MSQLSGQDMASTESLLFNVVVYIFLLLIILMSSAVLVNLGLDLKKGSKVHLVLLLGLSLHDALGAVASLPWISLYNHPDRAVCDAVVYFIRLYLVASATYVKVLSFERFLSLVAPFWYVIHVNVKTVSVTAVMVSVSMLLLTGVSFLESSVVEVKDATTNLTLTECLAFPITSISIMMAAVNLTNVTLTLVFNFTVIKKLHYLRSAVNVQDGNVSGREITSETALLRLVLALSVISVVTNLPFCGLTVWRLLQKETANSGRLALTVSGSMGCAANPLAYLLCTARYRRRLKDWMKRVLCLSSDRSQDGTVGQSAKTGLFPSQTGPNSCVSTIACNAEEGAQPILY